MENLAQEVGGLLRGKGLSLGAVESATGGLISYLVTSVPGSSDYYKGSVIAYSNEIKVKVVGVKEDTIAEYGAVSREVAEEMAGGGRQVLGVDICISDTGIAGPGGATPWKAVGLFYIGLAHSGGVLSYKYQFQGDREGNRRQAAEIALIRLKEYLKSLR